MGTRALVHFGKTPEDIWATIYVHSDGYPTGTGADLKRVFDGALMRNGIRIGSVPEKQVNGPGCAAAQFVAAEKDGPGGVYIYKTGTSDSGEDYTYTVYADEDQPLRVRINTRHATLYDGSIDAFDPKAVEKAERDADEKP